MKKKKFNAIIENGQLYINRKWHEIYVYLLIQIIVILFATTMNQEFGFITNLIVIEMPTIILCLIYHLSLIRSENKGALMELEQKLQKKENKDE